MGQLDVKGRRKGRRNNGKKKNTKKGSQENKTNTTFKTKDIQPWMSSDALKGLAVPAPLVVPIVYQPINVADPTYKNNCIIATAIINSQLIMPQKCSKCTYMFSQIDINILLAIFEGCHYTHI